MRPKTHILVILGHRISEAKLPKSFIFLGFASENGSLFCDFLSQAARQHPVVWRYILYRLGCVPSLGTHPNLFLEAVTDA
jgi:hypothetical protein